MTSPFVRFLAGLAAGVAGTLAVLGGLVEGIGRLAPERLPPPPLSNRIDFDEKLHWLRERPGLSPGVLAVGSSITLQHFDGSAFGVPGHVLNGATWGVQLHQTRYLADWYVDRYPTVRHVIVFLGLADFRDCRTTPATFFNTDHADAYLDGAWPVPLYAKYFAPGDLIGNALTIAGDRLSTEGLLRDEYGTQPRTLPVDRFERKGLFYGHIDPDPACFPVLSALARDLHGAGRSLTIAIPPVNPAYLAQVSGADQSFMTLRKGIKDAVAGTGTRVFDLTDAAPPASEYYDAFHMRFPAARVLSRSIALSRGGQAATHNAPAVPLPP
ncbi:MAG: hypothetical protein ACK5WM_11165 [Rhodospirillales bacterium]